MDRVAKMANSPDVCSPLCHRQDHISVLFIYYDKDNNNAGFDSAYDTELQIHSQSYSFWLFLFGFTHILFISFVFKNIALIQCQSALMVGSRKLKENS